jgi:hypothetical protein
MQFVLQGRRLAARQSVSYIIDSADRSLRLGDAVLETEQESELCLADADGVFQHGLENRFQLAGRT